jgi:sugar fermentation stimulation protein A
MMQFQTKLLPATLIKRYKRFLADVTLDGGEIVTAHCANPGSMMGLADAGTRVWVEPNNDPKKKLKYAWRLSEYPDGTMVCVDTSAANKIIAEALEKRQFPELGEYCVIRPEVRYAQNSRIDFLLENTNFDKTYLEVKSVTLSRQTGLAEFPDSVTARGAKHLGDLIEMVANGHRAIMFYLVQRTDCDALRIADDIDATYGEMFGAARAQGVEVMCYRAELTRNGQKVGKKVELL